MMADFSREKMIHAKLQLNFMNTNSVNSFSLGSFVLSFFLSLFLSFSETLFAIKSPSFLDCRYHAA